MEGNDQISSNLDYNLILNVPILHQYLLDYNPI